MNYLLLSNYTWFICIFPIVIAFGALFFLFFMLNKRKKQEKEFNEKLMKKVPEIEYTEIVSSSNGNNGIISTFNTDGDIGFGSYNSLPTTKFLVVYRSGHKEIVNLRDGTPLFNEYVRLLKK